MSEQILNRPPQFDKEMVEIVDYVLHYRTPHQIARAAYWRNDVPHGARAGPGRRTCCGDLLRRRPLQ